MLVEVEGTLNSRAITYEYDETSKEVLTPCHLLFGSKDNARLLKTKRRAEANTLGDFDI